MFFSYLLTATIIAANTASTAQATASSVDWAAFGMGLMGAILGSAASIGTGLYVFGRWQGRTDQRLDAVEARLDRGDDQLEDVPAAQERISVLKNTTDRLENIIDQLESRVASLDEKYVTRRECRERHRVDRGGDP